MVDDKQADPVEAFRNELLARIRGKSDFIATAIEKTLIIRHLDSSTFWVAFSKSPTGVDDYVAVLVAIDSAGRALGRTARIGAYRP